MRHAPTPRRLPVVTPLLLPPLLVGSVLIASSVLGGCLGPMEDDDEGYSPHLMPPDTAVPSVNDDGELSRRIDRGDGVSEEVVPLLPGWADGEAVQYWDFGPAPSFAIPVWLFRRCNARGEPLPEAAGMTGHMNLIDAVPGDPAYSPFWSMYIVCVTRAWDGELITNVEALRDAVTLGLVEDARPTGMWANCPVVLSDHRLEVGGGEEPAAPHEGYYRGRRTTYYHFGGMEGGVFPLSEGDHGVEEGRVYVLRRSSDAEPIDVVFGTARRQGNMPAPGYTPLRRVIRVVVSDDYGSGDLRAEEELVRRRGEELVPADGRVLEVAVTDEVLNLEIQYEEGRP